MSNSPHLLTEAMRRALRIPYALRHVAPSRMATVVPTSGPTQAGDIAIVEIERTGKNTRLELAGGRPCTLHAGDLAAVVFGNRYATMQFEGYARADGDRCDLLSMGGLCGLVESRHASVPDACKLRLLGMLGDRDGRPLALRSFALPAPPPRTRAMKVIVVCGSSMEAGKTHAATSLISGLRRNGERVAGIKLTGTAAGRDTWSMLDAGACAALDFIDGGYPSTYLVDLGDLLGLHAHLLGHAAAAGATTAVVEIADGLLQFETAALLGEPAFTETVDGLLFAAGDPLSAVSGARLLAGWGILPAGITGRVTMSPLGMNEVKRATGLPCFRAADLQAGPIDELFGGAAAAIDIRARAQAGAA